jgi:hypothetical protein
MLACLVAGYLTACSSGSGSSPLPPGPSAISVVTAGSLHLVGDQVAASATQGTYHGPFTYVSSNGKVLGLSLDPPAYGTKFTARLSSPDGRVYVVAISPGEASVKVYGTNSTSAAPPALQNVRISSASPVELQPGSLRFTASGSANSQTVAVTQDGYPGSFAQTDSCASIATVATKSNAAGKAEYIVTALAEGSCAASFAGGSAQTGTLPITVALASKIVLSPTSVTIKTTASQTVDVSQPNYTGTFDETDTCHKIANIIEKKNGGGNARYVVAPLRSGACNATFSGGRGATAKLPISVALPRVKLSPTSLSFTTSGSGSARAVSVSQTGYHGKFRESDDCANVATIVATSNSGGKAKYTVTASGTGSCAARFTGGKGEYAHLPIAVALPGPVLLVPSSLNFSATGSGHAQNVTVSQSGYTGSFSEIDDCSGISTVVRSTATVYTVTPTNAGSCTAVFSGGNGESAPLPISVIVPGDVTASPAPLNFLGTGAANAIVETVTQSSYAGTFTESDTCSGIAVFSTLTNAGGTATYRATPLAAGICHAVFTGGGGATFTLGVTVTETGFGVQLRHVRGETR